MNYISPEGFEVLCDLRVGDPPPVTESVTPPVQLLACVPSEDCGCPEEIWRINGIDVLIHLEEDGTGEMFVFAGDYEIEEKFDLGYHTKHVDTIFARVFGAE